MLTGRKNALHRSSQGLSHFLRLLILVMEYCVFVFNVVTFDVTNEPAQGCLAFFVLALGAIPD